MIFESLLSAMNSDEMADVFTVIDSSPGKSSMIGRMMMVNPDGEFAGEMDECLVNGIRELTQKIAWAKPVTLWLKDKNGDDCRVFWDKLTRKRRAIVFGGGHISQPLVQILSLLDFAVTVTDDRPEFANQARFPGASQVICESFQTVFKQLVIDGDTAVIIVTRGHRYDLDCVRATMGSDARYLGMIGSKKRVREMINLLKSEGAPPGFEERLRSPIGLDIKAETPAEIAVSIAAEVVAVFRSAAKAALPNCQGVG